MNHTHSAFRPLKNPGLTTVAVLSLAVGRATFVIAAEDFSTNPGFSIQQQGKISWLVRPNGERFFSLGVCGVSQGASRKDFDPANPSYAAWQHYADSNLWAKATLKRLKAWGFTTVGGWSDFQVLRNHGDEEVAFAPVLHVGSTAGAPWWDMWDPKIT